MTNKHELVYALKKTLKEFNTSPEKKHIQKTRKRPKKLRKPSKILKYKKQQNFENISNRNITINNLKGLMIKNLNNSFQNKVYDIIKTFNNHALIKTTNTYEFTIILKPQPRTMKKTPVFLASEIKKIIMYVLKIIRKPRPTLENKEIIYNKNKLPKLLDKYKVIITRKSNTTILPFK